MYRGETKPNSSITKEFIMESVKVLEQKMKFNNIAAAAEIIAAEGDYHRAAQIMNEATQNLIVSTGIKPEWEITNEVLRVKYL